MKILLIILVCLAQETIQDVTKAKNLISQSTQLNVPCQVDDDCNPPYIICSGESKLCEHKGIFPIYERELAGILIIPCLLSLFSIAGLGGGGVIIPLSMIFFVFDTKNAIAISNFAIFTCSVTRYLYTLDKKNPEKKEYVLIDYNIAIVMLPTVMMGSLTGVFLNIILPAIVLQLILTALLVFLGIQSLMKGKDMYKKETIKFEQESLKKKNLENSLTQVKNDESQHLLSRHQQQDNQAQTSSQYKAVNNFEIEAGTPQISQREGLDYNSLECKRLEHIIEKEKTHFQWDKHFTCISIFLILLSTNLLRGNKSLESIVGIDRCSSLDWIVLACFYVACFSITMYSISKVRTQQALKLKYNKGLAKCDIIMTNRNTLRLFIFSFIGGWISGALGLGGGAIFNPILIGLGTPPAVATATSMYMISFSSAGSTVTYIIYGLINIPFSIWVGIVGSFGATGGLALFNVVTKKYNRQSLIVFVLSGVLVFSALLVPLFGGLDLLKLIDRGEDIFEIHSICQ
ncbi:UNKNOWN [Stylonychia lemnae]|uniref:Sulfite exporter TauE/SafE n=1 Tax=Stylonychia lemnae TaxID=5949 RepID=A0A078ABC7_STYLE|nr:UNKNOWN [Stylonychia lemnae]|eukprot:CDW79605.1 UNKNOWN [Stylonychia lemnae]